MQFSFEVGILQTFGNLEPHYKEGLKKNYLILDKGYNSFSIKIPGTAYRRAVQARAELRRILSEIIAARREKRLPEKDLLGCLLDSNDGDTALTDDCVADNIIGVLFAAQDTTASAMTWIVKYLHDNPKLLQLLKVRAVPPAPKISMNSDQSPVGFSSFRLLLLQAEHKAIADSNGNGENRLSWSQTRNMPLTYKVQLIEQTIKISTRFFFFLIQKN